MAMRSAVTSGSRQTETRSVSLGDDVGDRTDVVGRELHA